MVGVVFIWPGRGLILTGAQLLPVIIIFIIISTVIPKMVILVIKMVLATITRMIYDDFTYKTC